MREHSRDFLRIRTEMAAGKGVAGRKNRSGRRKRKRVVHRGRLGIATAESSEDLGVNKAPNQRPAPGFASLTATSLFAAMRPEAPDHQKSLMNLHTLPAILAGIFAAHLALTPAHAGHMVEPAPDKSKIVEPVEDGLPPGMWTLGAKFSDGLQSGYFDSVTPFFSRGGFTFFLNTRSTLADNSQYLGSYGLGVRYLVPDREVILGANVYYDSLESQFGNRFDQLGIGLELLTRWFDARVNWYLPDDGIYDEGGFTRSRSEDSTGATFVENGLIKQRTTETTRNTAYRRHESALEGYNMEAGFLVPGVDRYFELRLLAGYYRYEAAFGRTFEGLKARAEARFLPGLIADVEYWDDRELVGGHWVAGIRATVPFSIGNLFTGKNPFEGASEMFRPRKREFRERLSEMVIRSHRVFTTQSDPIPSETKTDEETGEKVIGTVPPPQQSSPPEEEIPD